MSINDRDYMNRNFNSSFSGNSLNMIWVLIAINIIVFVLHFNTPLRSGEGFRYYQLLTSIFSHASFGHIFFNMFGLYIFGTLIVRHISFWKMLFLYLTGGILGNLLFIAFFRGGNYNLLGASGAVFGIMMAAAMLEPNQKFVMIFLPFFALKTKTLVVCYTIIEFMGQFNSMSDTAHLAHLGGFLGGYLFTRIFLKNQIVWDILDIFKPKHPSSQKSKVKVFTPKYTAANSGPVSQKELDYLLDKISAQGVNALSEQELSRLKQARREMRGEE